MERITWIIIGYTSITPSRIFPYLYYPSLIVVAIVVELVRFLPYTQCTFRYLVLIVYLKQGEIVARLTVHTTLRGESKIAWAAAASLVA